MIVGLVVGVGVLISLGFDLGMTLGMALAISFCLFSTQSGWLWGVVCIWFPNLVVVMLWVLISCGSDGGGSMLSSTPFLSEGGFEEFRSELAEI